MNEKHERILNPLGAIAARAVLAHGARHRRGARRVIGLLDNSKPNVAEFLKTIEEELQRSGDYEIVTAMKPRSAGPADVATLANRCDFVINAVAD